MKLTVQTQSPKKIFINRLHEPFALNSRTKKGDPFETGIAFLLFGRPSSAAKSNFLIKNSDRISF
jgi:hypothetical protein